MTTVTYTKHLLAPLILVAAICGKATSQATTGNRDEAQAVIAMWRSAVFHGHEMIHLQRVFTQDGLHGRQDEWVDLSHAYRNRSDRVLDSTEEQLIGNRGQSRDWNGFVRNTEGNDLKWLISEATQTRALAFGPTRDFARTPGELTPDRKYLVIHHTPPGGLLMTWYLDTKTGLPAKCVTVGASLQATAVFQMWTKTPAGVLPKVITVSSEGSDIGYELVEAEGENRPTHAVFAPLKWEHPDVQMQAETVTLPFTLEGNHIVVQARVNGHEPIGFIFDTGDDQETINASRMQELGIEGYGATLSQGGGNTVSSAYGKNVTLETGGATLRNQHVSTLDQAGLERVLGVKLGGILGYDFISRFVVEIDYASKTLTLHRPDSWRYTGTGISVPIILDQGVPTASANLSVSNSHTFPAHLMLDFGASDTMILTSAYVKANDLIRLAGTNTNAMGIAGMEKQFFAQTNMRGHLDELQLGELRLSSIPISLSANTSGAYASSSFDGTMGEGIFTRYHVWVDYPGSRMIFESTPETNKPFSPRRTFGLTLLSSGPDLHVFTVSAVSAKSPAAAAGFSKGDIIAAADGKRASEFTLGELRQVFQQDGTSHTFTVNRGGAESVLKVDVQLESIDGR